MELDFNLESKMELVPESTPEPTNEFEMELDTDALELVPELVSGGATELILLQIDDEPSDASTDTSGASTDTSDTSGSVSEEQVIAELNSIRAGKFPWSATENTSEVSGGHQVYGASEDAEPTYGETFIGGDGDEYTCSDAMNIYTLRRLELVQFLNSSGSGDPDKLAAFKASFIPDGIPSDIFQRTVCIYVEESPIAQLLAQQLEKAFDIFADGFEASRNTIASRAAKMMITSAVIPDQMPTLTPETLSAALCRPNVLTKTINRLLLYCNGLKIAGVFDVNIEPAPEFQAAEPSFSAINAPDIVSELKAQIGAELKMLDYLEQLFSYYCTISKKVNELIASATNALLPK